MDEEEAALVRALLAQEAPARRAVQSLAKKLGVKANAKTAVILEQLEALLPPEKVTDASVREAAAEEASRKNEELEGLVASELWPVASLEPALDEEAAVVEATPMDVDEDPASMDRRAMFRQGRADRSMTKAYENRQAKKDAAFKQPLKARPTQQKGLTKKPLASLTNALKD